MKTYYAVGYGKTGGLGYDIGEFDTFKEAVAAAIEAGGAAPTGIVDAADVIMQVGTSKTETVWIQRFPRGESW